jgi:hypothetical protein
MSENLEVKMMTADIAQGISVELRHILNPDWTFRLDQDGFIITPPRFEPDQLEKWQALSLEAWRIAQFVGYANFCSIEKTSSGGILITSYMASGNGFKITIEAN